MLHSINSIPIRNKFSNQPPTTPTPQGTTTAEPMGSPQTTTPIKNPSFGSLTHNAEKIIKTYFIDEPEKATNLISELKKLTNSRFVLNIKLGQRRIGGLSTPKYPELRLEIKEKTKFPIFNFRKETAEFIDYFLSPKTFIEHASELIAQYKTK